MTGALGAGSGAGVTPGTGGAGAGAETGAGAGVEAAGASAAAARSEVGCERRCLAVMSPAATTSTEITTTAAPISALRRPPIVPP